MKFEIANNKATFDEAEKNLISAFLRFLILKYEGSTFFIKRRDPFNMLCAEIITEKLSVYNKTELEFVDGFTDLTDIVDVIIVFCQDNVTEEMRKTGKEILVILE